MTPYAGFDPNEGKSGYYPQLKKSEIQRRRERAYSMFRAGADTFAISEALGISEAKALELVTRERSTRLGLLQPYGDRS